MQLYHDMYAAMVAKDEKELNRVHEESFVLVYIGAALLIFYRDSMTAGTALQSVLFLFYGMRLPGFPGQTHLSGTTQKLSSVREL